MSDPESELPARVLAVAAHPDDIDFGAAGTIATWTQRGVEVAYLIVTDGDAGGFDRGIDRREMPGIRRAEQHEAARRVGVKELTFLGRRDGEVVVDLELRQAIAREIRRYRPDLVLTQSPERNYERIPASHPDHRAVGEATLCAVYPDARNPFAFPSLLNEGLEPHRVSAVWLTGHPQADHHIDITAVLEVKIAAIASHHSQLSDPGNVERFVREWTGTEAERAGFGAGRHAEAFKVVHLP